MQCPTTSGGRTAGYRIGGDQSAGIPASPDGSAPSHVVTGAVQPHGVAVLAGDGAEALCASKAALCDISFFSKDTKGFSARGESGITKGRPGTDSMRIDSPGGSPCAETIRGACESEP